MENRVDIKTYIKGITDLKNARREVLNSLQEVRESLAQAESAWNTLAANARDDLFYDFEDTWEDWEELSNDLYAQLNTAVDKYD